MIFQIQLMRCYYIFILILFNNISFSQHKVSGIIKDDTGNPLPGITVLEIGTENRSVSNQKGEFNLITIKDSCSIRFTIIGFETKTISVTKDTELKITLEYLHFDYKWVTIGSNYDVSNNVVGLVLSNGFDEHPLYHFEDFSESVFYKVNASTNFNSDHSFNFKIAHNYAFRYVYFPTIAYRNFKYSSSNIHFKEVNLSFKFGLNKLISLITLKGGYQELNGKKNYGASTGFMNKNYTAGFYYGASFGYWIDYLTYEVHFQSLFFNKDLSLRVGYEKIDNFDFLKIGFHYTFNRVNNED